MSTLRGRVHLTGALHLEQQPPIFYNYVFNSAVTCAAGSYVYSDVLAVPYLLTWILDAPGATYLAYTPNGKKLVTAGVDNYCRVFTTGSDDEPATVDECQENNTAVIAGVGSLRKRNQGQVINAQRRMAFSLPAPKTGQ